MSMTGDDHGTTSVGRDGAGSIVARHQFVLGIFADLVCAGNAIENLLLSDAQDCRVLLISYAESREILWSSEEMLASAVERIHVKGSNEPRDLAAALQQSVSSGSPFAALWTSVSTPVSDGESRTEADLFFRLGQQLIHHLAKGAGVVVVRAQSAEQQLCASRTLLQSACEVLLTHDVAFDQVVTPGRSCCGATCPGTCRKGR